MDNEIRLKDQIWYIHRMKEAGYAVDYNGHCFGMSHMSMQAFLAEDMQPFNDRLTAISKMMPQDFNHDFENLRAKRQQLINEGNASEAQILTQLIVDLMAFFDGITLYQSTNMYKHLFESPDQIFTQDADKAMQLTLPINLASTDNQPVLINCYSGAYNKFELEQYITTLKNNLGEHSFSLILISCLHAINLNYDVKTEEWLLCDPNNLPGEKYTDASVLADALFAGYGQKEGVVMESSLYTTNKYAENVQRKFSTMKEMPEWIDLHKTSKLNVVYEDKRSQLWYASRRGDSLWIEQNIPFGLNFNNSDTLDSTPLMLASQNGDLGITELLIRQNINIDQRNKLGQSALMIAARHGRLNVIDALIKNGARVDEIDSTGSTALTYACLSDQLDAMSLLIDKGAMPTKKMLKFACTSSNVDMITLLLDKGVTPTQDELYSVCFSGKIDAINLLLDRGLVPDEGDLCMLVEQGKIEVMVLLFDRGMIPTEDLEDLLTAACNGSYNEPDINMINLLLDKGGIPTERILNSACQRENLNVINLLFDKGIIPTKRTLYQAYIARKGTDNIDVINLLLNKGVYPSEALLDTVCMNKDAKIAELFVKKLAQHLIDTMEIKSILKTSGVTKDSIDRSIDTLISNVVNDFKDYIEKKSRFDKTVIIKPEIQQSVLKYLDALIHDPNSPLTQSSQEIDHSIEAAIDALSVVGSANLTSETMTQEAKTEFINFKTKLIRSKENNGEEKKRLAFLSLILDPRKSS